MLDRLIGLIFVALIAASGCATPDSFSGYLEDRRHDLIDAFHADITVFEIGLVAYVGPLMAGYDSKTGFKMAEATGAQFGLGGMRNFKHPGGDAYGFIAPLSWWNQSRPVIGPRPKRSPSGFSIGFSGGLLFGFGMEADAFEFLDFVLGLACLDIGDDDECAANPYHYDVTAASPADIIVDAHDPDPKRIRATLRKAFDQRPGDVRLYVKRMHSVRRKRVDRLHAELNARQTNGGWEIQRMEIKPYRLW